MFYLKDRWAGEDFFQGWNWEAGDDPTHGRVNYVTQGDALTKNLSYGSYLMPLASSSCYSVKWGFLSGPQFIRYACR